MRALARWPDGQPLAALVSGGDAPRSRWSILAQPARTIITPALAGLAELERDLAELEPSFQGVGPGAGWLGPAAPGGGGEAPPLTSGWIGWISYGAGHVLEPAALRARRSDWPLMVWHRVESGYAHDAATGAWWRFGEAQPRLVGAGEAGAGPEATVQPSFIAADPEDYQAMVTRGIELIRAGDVYQVNLAHTIDGQLAASPRVFAGALLERAQPWFGAHIEHTGPDGRVRAVTSASPESLIEIEPVRGGGMRRIVSRPMKGTLPGGSDPAELARSSKDTAELDMIVDLMRNDLGRVCAIGSVRVEDRRTVERHAVGAGPGSAGVWQGVATVGGRLRARTTLSQVVRAVFPAGSVTGAPKIRAMQIIESMEERPRGPYCGCVGYIGDDGRVSLNVAIRTAMVEPADDAPRLGPGRPGGRAGGGGHWLAAYPVGAGIVADSIPEREWSETLHKARIFFDLSARPGGAVSGYLLQSGG